MYLGVKKTNALVLLVLLVDTDIFRLETLCDTETLFSSLLCNTTFA